MNTQFDTYSQRHVYVMEVRFEYGEYGFTSVHASYDGAKAALDAKISEFDAYDEFTQSNGQTYRNLPSGTVFAGDYYGSDDNLSPALSYGISRLEVKP